MKLYDLTELAARNLREALLRNSLTTLGIAVGVASLVAMLSLGVGLQALVSKRLASNGLFDAIFVFPRQQNRGFGRPARPAEPPERPRPLDDEAKQLIEKLPNVVEVYPEVRFPIEVRFGDSPHATVLAGLPASARTNGAFEGMQGAFFSSPVAEEAILQIEFAKELSDPPNILIGKDLVLRYAERQPLPPEGNAKRTAPKSDDAGGGFSIVPREKKLRIVGIIETQPGAGFGGFAGGRLFVPLQLAQNLRSVQAADLREIVRAGSKPSYSNLTVRVKSAEHVKAAEDSVKAMGFGAFSLLDATRNLRLVFTIFDLFLGIFGSLALAVASLGIINTLLMAILERRREIGILKALGAGDRDVKQLFFAEAGAMGLVGGALGVGLGWLIGRAITWGTNIYLHRRELPSVDVWSVPWWLVLGGIGFAFLVSLAAGVYPASRAARLNPVEALRYE